MAPQDESVGTGIFAARPENPGTSLSVTTEVSAPVCAGEVGTVTISGILTSTGSQDSADITVSVDGGAAVPVGVLLPADFSNGHIKHAPYSFDLEFPNGTYSVEVCFTQSGNNENNEKQVCTVLEVVVDCPPDETGDASCEGETVFGDLVGNPVLCSGNGTPHVPVHLRGDFGEIVEITITGPDEFVEEGVMNHAGESCIYQYNWDTQDGNHGDTGSYTFSFVGDNGNTYEFTRDLLCED